MKTRKNWTPCQCELFGEMTNLRLVRQCCICGWWSIWTWWSLFGWTETDYSVWRSSALDRVGLDVKGPVQAKSVPLPLLTLFGRLNGSAALVKNVLKNAQSKEIPPVFSYPSVIIVVSSASPNTAAVPSCLCSFKWHQRDQDKLKAFPSYFSL